ncbi:MAG: class I SAM-dependent methyltransferase [Bacteroidales bacterium]|nr:class I SAM-dependent methyltransferase [Bacteroidales bacterium]MCF8403482.1 class I SAM-dependent methyltransferase [Bacteroidales bacterium]
MEHIYKCQVCGSKQFKEFIITKDYFLSQEEFKIDECAECGLRFTNPRPERSNIDKYYTSPDYISHTNTSKGIINKLYKAIRTYTITRKIQLIKKINTQGAILDIGSGSGEFLFAVAQNGYKVTGVEPNELARKVSIEKYKIDILDEPSLNILPPKSFDIITMWHVLEHVYDIQDRIKQISRLLKDNGTLIIAVPNFASYDAKKYREHWAAYDLPRHVYHFSPKQIWRLFKDHHYRLERRVPMKFDSFYVSILSEKYKNGKGNIIKAILTGLVSNIIARFTKHNYSSLTYLFKKEID